MSKDTDRTEMDSGQLLHNNQELTARLKEANEIIQAIRQGRIDAVFIAGKNSPGILTSGAADQTYRRFIENMSEGIVTLLPDGTILYSNSSFAAMIDTPLEAVIGAKLLDFITVEYRASFENIMLRFPHENSKLELSVSNSQNKVFYFSISVNTLKLQEFEALNMVWTDVTQQKEAEQEVRILNDKLKENIRILKTANAELAAFAHVASHDLQEPLRKIITYSDLVRRHYYIGIDVQGQAYLDKIQRAALRMRHLIDDILEYSQISQSSVLFQPTNLHPILTDTLSDLEVVITETKASVVIPQEIPVINAIPSQIRQLFQNLISNSLKFIKPGVAPEISITYTVVTGHEVNLTNPVGSNLLNENFIVFCLRDNGIGFNPEYASKIFTIFNRLNHTEYNGTGIGLAICKRIVEKHFGFIDAASESNQGAVFTITLPFNHAWC